MKIDFLVLDDRFPGGPAEAQSEGWYFYSRFMLSTTHLNALTHNLSLDTVHQLAKNNYARTSLV